MDSGYDGTRLAFLLADLPVELLVRRRSDRVLYSPARPRAAAGAARRGTARMKLNDPSSWPVPDGDHLGWTPPATAQPSSTPTTAVTSG